MSYAAKVKKVSVPSNGIPFAMVSINGDTMTHLNTIVYSAIIIVSTACSATSTTQVSGSAGSAGMDVGSPVGGMTQTATNSTVSGGSSTGSTIGGSSGVSVGGASSVSTGTNVGGSAGSSSSTAPRTPTRFRPAPRSSRAATSSSADSRRSRRSRRQAGWHGVSRLHHASRRDAGRSGLDAGPGIRR